MFFATIIAPSGTDSNYAQEKTTWTRLEMCAFHIDRHARGVVFGPRAYVSSHTVFYDCDIQGLTQRKFEGVAVSINARDAQSAISSDSSLLND